MTVHVRAIKQEAEETFRKSLHAQHARERPAKGKVEENVGPYIVVSCESSAGNSEIAHMFGRKLGWDLLDNEIIDYLASEHGTPHNLVALADEKHVTSAPSS